MKHFNKRCIALLMAIVSSIFQVVGQQEICTAPSNFPNFLESFSASDLNQTRSNHYCVRIFIHNMRRSDGTDGLTEAEIQQGLNYLRTDYAPHGISFILVGTDEIWNTTYYQYNAEYTAIFADNDPPFTGKADGSIPLYLPENNLSL